MGSLPLSKREQAHRVACERIGHRIASKEQQASINPDSGPNDSAGNAEETPRETNPVGLGRRGEKEKKVRSKENQDDNDGRKVHFDDTLRIRWIESAGREPIFETNAPPVAATWPVEVLKYRPDHPFSSPPKILAEFEHGNPDLVRTFLTDDPRIYGCDDWEQSICTPWVNGAVILVDGLPDAIEIPISENRFLSARRVLKLVYTELMKTIEKKPKVWWRSVEKERRGEVARA
ncbi:uncharacterized protein BT62DRAFT_923043 [Guyanagaster necrorhizus]|uniref:Uncharacterized protein n=1 Tax=Guyanagaster necrorhizus TaxID=856835 RepID=A0A9P7VJG6_9AGAR|nr:uncharacterized protein BT62DRAFT_923043 [Guyanagaster necrorhizus MCA 3950]KAG7441819.1 hypothetical protein BT62DRAFT_923043 [Guyanagaster necrorhizus MCA 3950]